MCRRALALLALVAVCVGGGSVDEEVTAPSLTDSDEEGWRALWAGALDQLRREPALNSTREDVYVQLGGSAFLHCPVQHLHERGVSWIRRRDWHIISSGQFMYTNDERFQVLHSEGSDDWVLAVRWTQTRDAGEYSCQLATRAGVQTRLVELHVLQPEAFILGGDEHHVHAGSDLSLVCIIDKSPSPPQYVFWYHNARMINYDAHVSVRTERGARTQSSLRLTTTSAHHAGNYSCRATGAAPATIAVYVEQGSDKMAATLSRNSALRVGLPLVTITVVMTSLTIGRLLTSLTDAVAGLPPLSPLYLTVTCGT